MQVVKMGLRECDYSVADAADREAFFDDCVSKWWDRNHPKVEVATSIVVNSAIEFLAERARK